MENVNTEGLIRGVTYDTEPEKTYLILIDGEEKDEELGNKPFRDWEFKEGRQKAYDYIKDMLEGDFVLIDVYKSKVIVGSEKIKITDGISIYEFMKVMKEKDKVVDYSSFDIEDYINHESDSEGTE